MELGAHSHFDKMYESICSTPLYSNGCFWGVEELRHQEYLRRASHAQYLYRHRHDSNRAARLYREFMKEQNQWMNDQERMKEMESRLLVRAYKQRAFRREEELRRLEEGRDIKDILKPSENSAVKRVNIVGVSKPQGKGTVLFKAGTQNGFGEDHITDESSVFVKSPQSISSLDLPSPLLPYPYPSSRLVWFENTVPQVDGTQQTKIYSSEKRTEILASRPKHTASSILSSGARGSSLSIGSSRSYQPTAIPNPHEKPKRSYNSLLANSEVIRIISHKPQHKDVFLYLISWRLQNSNMPPVECWVGVVDFFRGSKEAVLEDYHLRHNLGTIRWPRNPRRQLGTSTSFGAREIKSALNKRKQTLLQCGADELEASQKVNEEWWGMRGDWQRAGGGWGSAMIAEGRKKAWEIADSVKEPIFTSQIKKVSEGGLGEDLTATMQDAGITRLGDIGYLAGVDLSSPYSSIEAPLSQPEGPLKSPRNISNSDHHGGLKGYDRGRSEFRSTSEDEREWREHFNLGPGVPSPHELSTSNNKISGLSRVKSTLHNLPGTHDFGLVRATLPERKQKVVSPQAPLQGRYQEPARTQKPRPPVARQPSVPDTQCYLEAQRETLLSRMFGRGQSKKQNNNCYKGDCSLSQPGEGAPKPLIFIETATRPLESSEDCPLGVCSGQSAASNLSSYTSFDGASSETKTQGGKNWTKTVWGKFSYLLASSSRASSSFDRKDKEIIMNQNKSGKQAFPPGDAKTVLEVTPGGSQAKLYRSGLEQHSSGSAHRAAISHEVSEEPQHRRFANQELGTMGPTGLAPLGPLLVGTAEIRTTSWPASVLPPLCRSKSEEYQKVGWTPPSTAGMVSTPSGDNPGAADTNQLSLEVYTRAEDPPDHVGHHTEAWRVNKSKGKAKIEMDYSPILTGSAPLTRSPSQEEYLIKREAEKQAQRDKALSETKAKDKEREEEAAQYAKDLKRLGDLQSKRTSLLRRWRKTDKLELKQLRVKLGIRPDKKKDTLRSMTVGDLKKLRGSLQSTTIATKTQPKGRSPI